MAKAPEEKIKRNQNLVQMRDEHKKRTGKFLSYRKLAAVFNISSTTAREVYIKTKKKGGENK